MRAEDRGASSGIGQATTEVLASRGASVSVADIKREAVKRVVQGLHDDRLQVTGLTVDVADEAQIQTTVDTGGASLADSTFSTTMPR